MFHTTKRWGSKRQIRGRSNYGRSAKVLNSTDCASVRHWYKNKKHRWGSCLIPRGLCKDETCKPKEYACSREALFSNSVSEPVSLYQYPCPGRSLMRLLKARRPGWHRLTVPIISDQMGCCGVGGTVSSPVISPRLTHKLNPCLKLS